MAGFEAVIGGGSEGRRCDIVEVKEDGVRVKEDEEDGAD